MPDSRPIRRLLACAALGFTLGAAADADPSAFFDAGVAAYRAGDTAAALAAFEQARTGGLDTPQLHFNLGLAYYRQGRNEEARAAFEQLARFPDYRHVAEYHLGLVAARAGERGRAEALLRAVERDAPQAALRDRARFARDRLGSGPGTGLFALLLLGHDSNPALADDDLQSAEGSPTAEVFAAADLPLSRDSGVSLQAGVYSRSHDGQPALDQRVLLAGLARERLRDGRRRRVSLDLTASQLDGESFTRTVGGSLESRPPTGRAGTTLRAELARVDASKPHAHLEGWRLRAEAERTVSTGAARLRAGLQLELNDREDLRAGKEFFSHSPQRARLSLGWERPLGGPWSLQAGARLRHSAHADANRYFDGAGILREKRRADTLVQGVLRVRRSLGDTAGWLLEYQYGRNDSSIDVYGYDRHLLLTGLEWQPRVD